MRFQGIVYIIGYIGNFRQYFVAVSELLHGTSIYFVKDIGNIYITFSDINLTFSTIPLQVRGRWENSGFECYLGL